MPNRKKRLVITGSVMTLFSAVMLGLGLFVAAQSKWGQIEFFNGKTLEVEIAETREERALGLMYREALEENSGMLFIYPESTESGFWMKNTRIPLSIAFINEKGIIVDIKDMKPCEEENCPIYYSDDPYRFALEVNKGWFEENKVFIGEGIKLN